MPGIQAAANIRHTIPTPILVISFSFHKKLGVASGNPLAHYWRARHGLPTRYSTQLVKTTHFGVVFFKIYENGLSASMLALMIEEVKEVGWALELVFF